ncbi:MAG: hypothetical protein ABL966_16770, partial [Acidimicrobiales bacterium]
VRVEHAGEPVDPCAALPAGSGHLLVVPDPLVLPSGDLEDVLHVRNCGTDAVDWTAATKPTVTLAASAGTLAPGEVSTLGFAIQADGWDPGAIDFKIKLSEPGHSQYVDVHAYRPLVGADVVASTELSAGPGVGGCSDQCITKALLVRAMTTPDVGLDVATTVPARIRVYLSTQAPGEDQDGNPVFPGVPAKATSPVGVQAWTASLANLQASTKYFIIVKATDADGETAYRSGSFRTITPYEAPSGGLAPQDLEPGCANFCITKAVVTPGEGLDPSHLSVRSHTPARFQLFIGEQAPVYAGGVPSFSPTHMARNNGDAYAKAWELDIEGLEPGTTFYGIVRATDANGKRHYAVGSFTTDRVDVLITIHRVHVSHDGDDGKYNRGELRFAWGVGDDTVGIRDEEKLHTGSNVGFGNHTSYTVHNAGDPIPTVYVSAGERDADGLAEFCTMGIGAHQEAFYSASCDTKWNVAASEPLRVDQIADLDDCSSLGIEGEWGDEPCALLVSEDHGDDYPKFWAVVSYTVLD